MMTDPVHDANLPAESNRPAESVHASLKPLVCLLAVSLLVQIPLVSTIARLTPATREYDFTRALKPAAESILQGRGPRLEDGSLLIFYPPGYPFLAAGLYALSDATGIPFEFLTVGVNIGCNLLTMTALFLLANRLGGRRLAIVAAILAGMNPCLMYLAKFSLPQLPYLAILAWALYFLYRAHQSNSLVKYTVCGLLLALAAIFRPEALAVIAAATLYVLIFFQGSLRHRLQRPAVMLVTAAIVLAPWSIYVWNETGKFIVAGDVASAHLTGEGGIGDQELNGIEGVQHLSAMAQKPLSHSLELLRRSVRAWYRTNSGQYERPAAVVNAPYALLIAAGTVICLRRPPRWGFALCLWTFLCFWALTTTTVCLARYLSTGIVLASPISACAVCWLLDRFMKTPHPASVMHGQPSAPPSPTE